MIRLMGKLPPFSSTPVKKSADFIHDHKVQRGRTFNSW